MIINAIPRLTLAAAKNSAKSEVNKKRDAIINSGIYLNDVLFDTDPESLRNISYWHLQIISGAVLPEGFMWRDANNIDHPADEDFIKELSLAVTSRGTLIYQASWLHKANIDALNTFDEVKSYDISIGWPD